MAHEFLSRLSRGAPTPLADIVSASLDVAATRSRLQKTQRLATLLGSLAAAEVQPGVGFLCGELRQGKLGVGYASLRKLRTLPPAEQASVSVLELDEAFERLAALSGKGSAGRREPVSYTHLTLPTILRV